MDYGLNSAYMEQAKQTAALEMRRPTTRERLEMAREGLTKSLADVNEAIAALDSNPEFERIHNLLSRVL